MLGDDRGELLHRSQAIEAALAPAFNLLQVPGQVQRAAHGKVGLGHTRTNTFHVVDNLRKALPDNEETAKLDLILLAGDIFDHLLTLPQEEVDEIQAWITELLAICAKYNILLRVLEGTPSHDWKQSRQFVNLNLGAGVAKVYI